MFRKYCGELGIINRYSTPAYLQGNGHAEAVNKVIVSGLKKILDDAKGKWVEELPHVLWTYRTTRRRSTGETPFSLTYGAEAVIPLETGFPTTRTSSFNPKDNDEQLTRNLDLIEEKREDAMIQLTYYQQKLKQGYDAINMCFLYKMFMPFVLSYTKCLNLTPLMPGVLGPDDLG